MKINDEMRNGIPWEAIEDYYETLEEPYFNHSFNNLEQIKITKKLYKKCVD